MGDRKDSLFSAAVAREARRRVRKARGEGVERLWLLQADALERFEDALQNAPDMPVINRVTDVAERAVHQRLESVRTPPVDAYDELNAKEVRATLRELPRLDLVKLRRYENLHKNRKSVLGDIERELERRDRLADEAHAGSAAPEAHA